MACPTIHRRPRRPIRAVSFFSTGAAIARDKLRWPHGHDIPFIPIPTVHGTAYCQVNLRISGAIKSFFSGAS